MVKGVLNPSVTVQIQRDAQDYREAYAWLRWRSWTWPVNIGVSLVVSAALLFTIGSNALPYVAIWAVVLVIGYFVSLRRVASRMQNAHVRNGATSYTFNANGFEYRSDVGHSETSWHAVNRAAETRRSFLLVYANTCFLVIPKRCVASDDLATLREMLGKSGRNCVSRP